VPIEYKIELPPFDEALLLTLTGLSDAIFGQPIKDIGWRLENMPCPSVVCARAAGQLVGFKAGYAMSQSKYYSWLGGVHPSSQRQGIASQLMELQHRFLGEQRFEVIETAADEGNTSMSQANLKHGFIVCGLRNEPHRVQVLFSKALRRAASA
jgi:GNAT superfamily N-acetyltransferase